MRKDFSLANKRIEELLSNELTIKWSKSYNTVERFAINVGESYQFTNTSYVDMMNAYYVLEALQPLIDENYGIYDWVKEYTNEVLNFLTKALSHIEYDPYNDVDENCLVADEIAQMEHYLFQIKEKYYNV